MRRRAFVAACGLLVGMLPAAEPLPEDRGAAGLFQALRKLTTNARVLYLTAHPDDEDGGTITWLTRGHGVEVTLLSLTRGESGANLVTGDFFDALGALRTLELLKAAQYYGCDVRFSRHIDYGYSKNVAETWRNWKQEEVLRDVVRVIRQVRPHVILTRFQGTPRDGHGNHEASGVIGPLAFEVAGDPKRFPEQIAEGLEAWQPLKIYSNNRRENDDWTVRVDSGQYDPVLGRSYAQMAREGLRHQRSQGAGSVAARPGPQVSYYKLIASKVGMAEKEASFLERTAAWPSGALLNHGLTAQRLFHVNHPEPVATALANGMQAARASEGFDAERKQIQYADALARALGLELEALVLPDYLPTGPFSQFRPFQTFGLAVPGQSFPVEVRLHNRTGQRAEVDRIELVAPPGWTVRRDNETRFTVTVPAVPEFTQAHWSRDSVRENLYRINPPAWTGRPLPPEPLIARAVVRYRGAELTVDHAVETSYIDSIGVQHRRTLAVGPAISLRFASEFGVLPDGSSTYSLRGVVRNNGNIPIQGAVRLSLPNGWRSEPASAPFAFEKEKEEATVEFAVTASGGSAREVAIEAVAAADGKEFRRSFDPITFGNLGTVHLSRPAVHRLRRVDVRVSSGLRVGYVMGTGDEVPEALRQLGVPVDLLDSAALAAGDLSKYSTILLGIRAYAARNDVKVHNARLLEYVRQGGVLVVQYNTQEYDSNYGPFPYKMTAQAEEVSEEDSPVEILDPADPAFTTPNKITAADFDGWVEQRGSKLFSTWDPAYKPLLATHDTGQAPQRGGWLVARHGKGLYIYCAYAWYRQLPFAVPGAYRLFANLVSLGAPAAAWRR